MTRTTRNGVVVAFAALLALGGSAAMRAEPQKLPDAKITKDVTVMTGAALGGVKFEHKKHAERADNKCTACHHEAKKEKAGTKAQQACSDCHTKVAAAPMKTKYQAAFHDGKAQAGVCITCHKEQNAKGKKAPAKCNECHKKENK